MKRAKQVLTICLFTILPLLGNSQPSPKLKSVFIYNFIKYIEWPTSYQTGDFVIGVLGESQVTRELRELAKTKKAGTQSIVIKTFRNVNEISKCHLLFIPKEKSGKMDEARIKIKSNTLVVTDGEGLTKHGAAINFIYRNEKQQFELNKTNIAKYGLKVSSSLLRLSASVSN